MPSALLMYSFSLTIYLNLLSLDFKIEVYNWQADVAYGVILTKVISPWEFNIQIISEENDRLMEQMW